MGKLARYRVRRVEILPGVKFGCAGGLLAALPLGLLSGGLARLVVSAVRHMLEGWQSVPFDLGPLGQASLDVVTLLHLNDWLARARVLDDAPWLVIGVALLVAMALLGSIGSLLGGTGAFVYNSVAAVSGGLGIELELHE